MSKTSLSIKDGKALIEQNPCQLASMPAKKDQNKDFFGTVAKAIDHLKETLIPGTRASKEYGSASLANSLMVSDAALFLAACSQGIGVKWEKDGSFRLMANKKKK